MDNAIFKIGKVTTKFYIPIFTSIISFFLGILNTFQNKFENSKKSHNLPYYGNHPFIHNFFMFLAEAATIFVYLIQEKLTDKKNKQAKIKNEEENTLSKNIIRVLLVILCAVLDLIGSLFDWATTISSNLYSNIFKALFILLIVGLCVLILHLRYYRHHAIGIIIIFIGYIIDTAVNYSYKGKMNIVIYILLMSSSQLFAALQDVVEKYTMEKMFLDPLLMLAGEGFVGVIIVGISFFVIDGMDCSVEVGLCKKGEKVEDLSVSFGFLGSNYQYIIIFFCRFLVHLVYNILRVLTNFHYSPAHRVIPKTFRSFIVWLWAFIPFFGSNASEPFLINLGTLASYLFQMIGVLIFVEVLIISVFGIDKNIEEEITRREMSEFNNRIDGLIVTTKEEEDDKPIELA